MSLTYGTEYRAYGCGMVWYSMVHPAAVRCDMVLHQAFRARRVRKNGIGGEVRHGVTSDVSCETSLNMTCDTSPPQGVRCGWGLARCAGPGGGCEPRGQPGGAPQHPPISAQKSSMRGPFLCRGLVCLPGLWSGSYFKRVQITQRRRHPRNLAPG